MRDDSNAQPVVLIQMHVHSQTFSTHSKHALLKNCQFGCVKAHGHIVLPLKFTCDFHTSEHCS